MGDVSVSVSAGPPAPCDLHLILTLNRVKVLGSDPLPCGASGVSPIFPASDSKERRGGRDFAINLKASTETSLMTAASLKATQWMDDTMSLCQAQSIQRQPSFPLQTLCLVIDRPIKQTTSSPREAVSTLSLPLTLCWHAINAHWVHQHF